MNNLAGIQTENNIDYKTILTELSEHKYQSKVYNNGEFDYCHCIDIVDRQENNNKFEVFWGIAKTKKYLTKKQLRRVLTSMSITQKECETFDIYDFGYSAHIDQIEIDGSEINEVLNAIASRIDTINNLFGFYMDKQNRIGKTGWDLLNGNINIK
jgi:hypothetical protein